MRSFACKDVGVKCDWSVTDQSDDRIVQMAEEHARKDHGYQAFTEEEKQAVRANIKDVQAAGDVNRQRKTA